MGNTIYTQDCGCEIIVWLDHSGLESAEIEYCSKHTAAPAMFKALHFARSVIKSGEPWTDTCEEIINAALELAKPEESE